MIAAHPAQQSVVHDVLIPTGVTTKPPAGLTRPRGVFRRGKVHAARVSAAHSKAAVRVHGVELRRLSVVTLGRERLGVAVRHECRIPHRQRRQSRGVLLPGLALVRSGKLVRQLEQLLAQRVQRRERGRVILHAARAVPRVTIPASIRPARAGWAFVRRIAPECLQGLRRKY